MGLPALNPEQPFPATPNTEPPNTVTLNPKPKTLSTSARNPQRPQLLTQPIPRFPLTEPEKPKILRPQL